MTNIGGALGHWSLSSELGFVAQAPGIIFADDDDVAPDVVWVSRERLPLIVEADGKFHAAPELVVEVLSPGAANVRRDREIKLDLYGRRGVWEYWLVDWVRKELEIYRQEGGGLVLVATLGEGETLPSPLLTGFSCPVSALFYGVGVI